MPNIYRVFRQNEDEDPKCDYCGFEDEALETTESDEGSRKCRYCFETTIPNHRRTHFFPAQCIAQAMNVLELVILQEMRVLVVGLAKAIADDTSHIHNTQNDVSMLDRLQYPNHIGGVYAGQERRSGKTRRWRSRRRIRSVLGRRLKREEQRSGIERRIGDEDRRK